MLDEYIKNIIELDRPMVEETYHDEKKVNEILYNNGMIIQCCKRFLTETDYVVVKMSEDTLLGKSIDELQEKYNEVIEARNEARLKISELEKRQYNENN